MGIRASQFEAANDTRGLLLCEISATSGMASEQGGFALENSQPPSLVNHFLPGVYAAFTIRRCCVRYSSRLSLVVTSIRSRVRQLADFA
jgi:hypothetical protein